MKKIILASIFCFIVCTTLLIRCGIYSFSGVTLHPDIKTVTVGYFQNMAPLIEPSLSNTYTDALQQKFIRNTRLEMVSSDGDIQVTGEIRGYDVAPAAITGDDFASQNRLTIRVNVKFENKIQPEQNFEREFSAYEDFPGQESIDSWKDELIKKITETLTENIFIATVANW
jgi:hypothetical protein